MFLKLIMTIGIHSAGAPSMATEEHGPFDIGPAKRRLVPAVAPGRPRHLADVAGWLDERDPFFARIEEIVAARSTHRPCGLTRRGAGPGHGLS